MLTAFFEDTVGRFHSIARIKSYRKITNADESAAHFFMVTLDDDREVQCWRSDLRGALRAAQPFVPALAGTELVTLSMPDDEPRSEWRHWREPVLGWRTNVYGGLEPLVLDCEFDELEHKHAVKMPDGSVVNLYGSVWPSVEEFQTAQFDQEEQSRCNSLSKEQSV